jgi:S1-C subfamily serine protease
VSLGRAAALAAAALAAGALAACGGSGNSDSASAPAATRTVEKTTKVEVVKGLSGSGGSSSGSGFDPAGIYRRESPGVVTVISLFADTGSSLLGGGGGGVGSGFVLNGKGEIATNAHVVTSGQGSSLRRAREVYVQFNDRNQVPAKIIGADPNADVALLRIDPAGLTLRPVPLGNSADLTVGAPVAAIGSPFNEPQSLSVGVISALDRTIDSLTNFSISGAIQTDAAINPGNSGGPLVNANGEVLGINSQIRSNSGSGSGVGFAVPVDMVRNSIDQLRAKGKVSYAYVGISSVPVFPQLARHFKLGTDHGAWVQELTSGGPAKASGLRAGGATKRFEAQDYNVGGDVIVRLDGTELRRDQDLSDAIAHRRPGDRVDLVVVRGGKRRTISVKLGERPLTSPSQPQLP